MEKFLGTLADTEAGEFLGTPVAAEAGEFLGTLAATEAGADGAPLWLVRGS